VWDLKAVGTGVLVRTSESFDGWLVRLFRSPFQRLLDKALEEALRSLRRPPRSSVMAGAPHEAALRNRVLLRPNVFDQR
jgi:hypothetical protein